MQAAYILLIGDNASYAHWAVNLACTIRLHSPSLHIVLLHGLDCEKNILPNEIGLFDEFIEVDKEDCYEGEKLAPGKMKLNLYKYFKHEENMYIDCDSLIINDLQNLFDKCSEKDVVMDVLRWRDQSSTGWECKWLNWNELFTNYQLPETFRLPECNSSFIYSKKNETAEKFWDQAAKNIIPNYLGLWGQAFPDELAFNVAFAQMGIDPDIGNVVSFDSKINNAVVSITKLQESKFILTYWGGKNYNYITHYKYYDILSHQANRKILQRYSVYKINDLLKKKYIQVNRSPFASKPHIIPTVAPKYVKGQPVNKITIIGRDNGVGLTKDRDILTSVLQEKYKVEFRAWDKYTPLSADNDVCIWTELAGPNKPGGPAYYGKYNILIPNQEWFFTDWIKELKNYQAIWVKTKLAHDIFSSMHPNVRYIGFTSVDMYKEGEKVKECFHTKGKSQEKGTEHLQYWASDLPKLNLISMDNFQRKPNLNHIKRRLPDNEFISLANRCLIHLCPSTMEGFGHYINEAKSMGCVVITTDSAPMNELVTDKRFLCQVTSASRKEGTLGTYTRTSYEEIDRVVRSIIDLDLVEIGKQNREEFLKQDVAFKTRLLYELSQI